MYIFGSELIFSQTLYKLSVTWKTAKLNYLGITFVCLRFFFFKYGESKVIWNIQFEKTSSKLGSPDTNASKHFIYIFI